MRGSSILRLFSSNAFHVSIESKKPNWESQLFEGEKAVGYSSSIHGLVNFKSLFNEQIAALVGDRQELTDSQHPHPLFKIVSTILQNSSKLVPTRSILLLLISKAAGIPANSNGTEMIKNGIHEHQRQLAEVIEMSNGDEN